MRIDLILRFMEKFELGSIPAHRPELGQCWEWKAGKNRQGYAKFREGATGSKTISGHCFSYKYFIGKIPSGLQLDHLCCNKSCVNPWHLEPVTGAENTFRGPSPNRNKTHCKKGHKFTDINTWIEGPTKNGRFMRHCRTCMRIRSRNQYRVKMNLPIDDSNRLRPYNDFR